MRQLLIGLLFFLLLVEIAHAGIIAEDATGFNSKTYGRNLQDIIYQGTDRYETINRFNMTQIFTGGDCPTTSGGECLWVPWYSSSSQCVMRGSPTGQLKTYGSGACSSAASLDEDTNGMVTDEFSEVGMVLAAGNASVERLFVAWMNTVDLLGNIMTTFGDIPVWSACRDGSTVSDTSGQDGASDATHRIALALYMAGNNSGFMEGNRTRAKQIASKLMNQSIQYDTTGASTVKSAAPRGAASAVWTNVAWWLFLGEDAKGFGTATAEDMYIGYYQDAILACIAHAYAHQGNTTLRAVCGNWTVQALAMSNYDGGTSGSSFNAGHYRFAFNESGGVVRPGASSGYESFFGSGATWDTADATRFNGFCRVYRAANMTGFWNMNAYPMKNVSDFCQAWGESNTWDASNSNARACLAYRQDGTCANGPYDAGDIQGAFVVGTLAMGMTYMNSSQFVYALTEINRDWSWTNYVQDGQPCGNGLTYQSVRFPKAFVFGIGYDEPLYGGQDPRSTPPPDSTKPVISNFACGELTNSSILVTWNTDEGTNESLLYGTTTSFGSSVNSNVFNTVHSVNVTGFANNTKIYFNITAWDSSGNFNTSGFINCTTLQNDITPPGNITVNVSEITASGVRINVSSNESSNLTVCYGTTVNLGTCVYNTTYAINSTVVISGLTDLTTYYANATKCDVGRNCGVNGTFSWTTLAISAGDWHLSDHVYGAKNLSVWQGATWDNIDAFSMNGANQSLNGTQFQEINLTGNFSITFTIKFNNLTTRQTIISDTDGSNPRFVVQIVSNEIAAGFYNGSVYFSKSVSVNDYSSYHSVAITYSGNQTNGTMNIYIDNTAGTGSSSPQSGGSPSLFRIGGRSDSQANGQWLNASIKDVRIFNRTISTAEIRSISNNETTALDAMVAWYNFKADRQVYRECKTVNFDLQRLLLCSLFSNANFCRYDATGCYDDRPKTTAPTYACVLNFVNSTADNSGNGRNIDFISGPVYNQSGQYYSNEVSNGYMFAGNSSQFNFGNNFTISAWYLQRRGTGNSRAIVKGSASSVSYALSPGTPGYQMRFFVQNASGSNIIATDSFIMQNDTWYHFAGQFLNNGTVYLFRDGVRVATSTGASTFTVRVMTENITFFGGSVAAYINGSMDDIRMWNTSLSDEEMLQVYANSSVRTDALVAQYKFTNQSETVCGVAS